MPKSKRTDIDAAISGTEKRYFPLVGFSRKMPEDNAVPGIDHEIKINTARKVDAINWQLGADNLNGAIVTVGGKYFYLEDTTDWEEIASRSLTEEEIDRLLEAARGSFLETAFDLLSNDYENGSCPRVERAGDAFLVDGKRQEIADFVFFAKKRGAITADNQLFYECAAEAEEERVTFTK